jgi:hypothetical protein
MKPSVFEPFSDDVCLHPGIDTKSLDNLETSHRIPLPADHCAALRQSNGAEIYGGYGRLFGVDTENSIDIARWNHPSCWKFAWNGRCSQYWCFAETAWGDQFAYNIDELRGGSGQVYCLDCLTMDPMIVASSFSEFMEEEFIPSVMIPLTIEARRKFGQLYLGNHLVHFPSLLIGGTERIENIEKMPAQAAMICNGDIAIQVDAAPPGRRLVRMTTYEDEAKRPRLQFVWS